MKKPWILLLVSTMAAFGRAQAQEPIEPKEADHKLVAYGKDKRQVLHLWLPKTKSPAPLVLHYHVFLHAEVPGSPLTHGFFTCIYI